MARMVAFDETDMSQFVLNDIFTGLTDTYHDSIDWSTIAASLTEMGLPSWANQPDTAIDSYVDLQWTGDNPYSTVLLGSDITMNGARITGGTVRMVAEVHSDTDEAMFAIRDFAVSAVSFYRAMRTADTADDRAVLAAIFAGDDDFVLSGTADVAYGYGGNDTMRGNGGNDQIYGLTGADRLLGNDGNDLLVGGTGNDTLIGGDGNDRIVGQSGRDYLAGNAGRDAFIFNAISETGSTRTTADVITDFTSGVDRINLSTIDASSLLDGNNSFTFIGTESAGNGNGGTVRYQVYDNAGTTNDYTMIYIDNDNDPQAEAVIQLSGIHTLEASDFIL